MKSVSIREVVMVLFGIVIGAGGYYIVDSALRPARMPVETALRIQDATIRIWDRRWMIQADYDPTTATFIPRVPPVPLDSSVSDFWLRQMKRAREHNCREFEELNAAYRKRVEAAGTGGKFPEFHQPVECPKPKERG